jgi:hypothetical protein
MLQSKRKRDFNIYLTCALGHVHRYTISAEQQEGEEDA